MDFNDQNEEGDYDQEIRQLRQERSSKFEELGDFGGNYTVEKLMQDLINYFDGEVDFNLDKIRETVSKPGKLKKLINTAKAEDTHPVTELLKDLFKNSACEDD